MKVNIYLRHFPGGLEGARANEVNGDSASLTSW